MENNVLNLITKFALELSHFVNGEIPDVEIHLSDDNCKKLTDEIRLYAEARKQSGFDTVKLNNVTIKDQLSITFTIK